MTVNLAQYNASDKSRGSQTIWLNKCMTWFAAASGKHMHSPKLYKAAIQFCLTLKSIWLAATTGNWLRGVCAALVGTELTHSGLPHLVQMSVEVQDSGPFLHTQSRRLHVLVNSTGIKFLGKRKCKSTALTTAASENWH